MYHVQPIPRSLMADFVAAHHYAVRVPPHCLLSLGCFVGSDLVGVASWGYGVRPRHTIQRLFPSLTTSDYYELNRLCMLDSEPRNGESHFLRLCREYIRWREPGGAAMVLAKGVGIRAGSRPMSMYKRHPGEVHGHNWYFPNVKGTQEFPHVAADVNWWKTFVHARLSVAPGDPGALTLFGKSASEHALFAEHIAGSETWTLTHGHGRDVQEWKLKPSRPDNHWLDCLVGCAVAASICGVKLPGMDARPGRQRKRYTQEDFRRKI